MYLTCRASVCATLSTRASSDPENDPLTFASSLVEEYNVLYDGLMEGGLEDASAREWLERVRRRGMEARFTCDPARIKPIVELPNPLRDYPSQVL